MTNLNIPTAKINKKRHSISSIWLVPIAAVLISAWLTYQYFAGLGIQISIHFSQSGGLKVGSLVKYKDIPVGKVSRIVLDVEEDGVEIIVNMDTQVDKLINIDTKFWIVKPEISLSGVYGLDAILSGSYINMKAEGTNGLVWRAFSGLDQADYAKEDANLFHLKADNAQQVSIGTPIYYNGIRIGQVAKVEISNDAALIDLSIYIDSDYLPYVHKNSRFWLQELTTIAINHGKLSIKTPSLKRLLNGGIELSTLNVGDNLSVPSGHVFKLYDSKQDSQNQSELGRNGDYQQKFMVHTTQNIAKLSVGAQVQYQQYQLGEVQAIHSSYNHTNRQIQSSITFGMDVSAFTPQATSVISSLARFEQIANEGLGVQIMSANPITGALFLSLAFDDTLKNQASFNATDKVLPAIYIASDDILDNISQLSQKLSKLPIEQILGSINDIVSDAKTPIQQSLVKFSNVISILETVILDVKKLSKQPSLAQIPNKIDVSISKLDEVLNSVQVLVNDNQKGVASGIDNLNKILIDIKTLSSNPSLQALPQQLQQSIVELNQALKGVNGVLNGHSDNLLSAKLSQLLHSITQTTLQLNQLLSIVSHQPNALIFKGP